MPTWYRAYRSRLADPGRLGLGCTVASTRVALAVWACLAMGLTARRVPSSSVLGLATGALGYGLGFSWALLGHTVTLPRKAAAAIIALRSRDRSRRTSTSAGCIFSCASKIGSGVSAVG